MNAIKYLKAKGIKRALQVIWRYKIDILIQKIYIFLFKNKALRDVIVLESHNDFDSNGGAFYDYLLSYGYNKKYKIVWLIRNKKPEILPNNVECFGIYNPSFRKDFYLVNAKYIMTCKDAIGSFRSGQISCYLTHGAISLKNTRGKIFVPDNMTYILAPSQFLAAIQANCLSIQYPNKKQVILGYPCHDVIYNLKHGDLYKITQIKYKKVILWMPTFRKLNIGSRNDSAINYSLGIPIIETLEEYEHVNKVLNKLNMLLILKIHPMQDLSQIRIHTTSNIIVLDGKGVKRKGIDNYRLMVDVDAMISDYSSAGIDFLHTKKPIAYTTDDMNSFKLGFIVDNVEELMPGYKIRCLNDLCNFFNVLSSGVDVYKEARQEVLMKMFNFCDGNSSKRLADFLNL